ncbi:hypothetical protein TWF718_000800 [Orbilia javanica]|uniref:ribonuclease H n=1 Tax=Orbilia javanica TaxID=47235 RepID=A0AAN8N4R0_9PEZI
MIGPTTENRRFVNCPSVTALDYGDQIPVCDCCNQFTAMCCLHYGKACHHHRVFFADGACLNNGKEGARAGVGVAGGENKHFQVSTPFSDLVGDGNGSKRTNQIAELRAAIEAVAFIEGLCKANKGDGKTKSQSSHRSKRRKLYVPVEEDDEAEYEKDEDEDKDEDGKNKATLCIIAMDSEYVVKGMTAWFPMWRKHGWKTSKGNTPANLDLFLALEREICRVEDRGWNIRICFWWVPREHNKVADRLAKNAAQLDTGED